MSYSVSFESESITDLDNLDQVVRLRILIDTPRSKDTGILKISQS